MRHSSTKKLAIVTTHPIQYNAPLFAMLHRRGLLEIKVFYTWGAGASEKKFDPGFGKNVAWDIPLLQGYEYAFAENIAEDPGSHHFTGIDTPLLINTISSWKADAIMIYGWAFKSHLKLLRHFHGKIPVLFRGDSISLRPISLLKRMIRTFFLKWVYSHVDYALYVGTHNKNYFKQLGLSETRLIFAPHAIDNERFAAASRESTSGINKWRSELNIPPEAIVLLYAGKLDTNKNVGLLAAAFEKMRRPDVHLVIAGNGEKEGTLLRLHSDNPEIHFLPFQNQSTMPLLYGMADIFVLPSLSETWGLGINEAMACGNAIVASDSCGAAIDLVKDNQNGYVFKSNDLEDLTEKLIKITGNKTTLKNWGERSKQIIAEWNYSNTCTAIENILFSKGQIISH